MLADSAGLCRSRCCQPDQETKDGIMTDHVRRRGARPVKKVSLGPERYYGEYENLEGPTCFYEFLYFRPSEVCFLLFFS